MISGLVNADLEAVIRCRVGAAVGRGPELEFVLDTGFNGSLTLPPALIAQLRLRWRSRGLVILANGAEDVCEIYTAVVVWDGQPRQILVESANTEPLVGMALLSGYDLRVQVKPGGRVRIRRQN